MSLRNKHSLSTEKCSLERLAEIILAFAKVLFVNGQTTTQVIFAVNEIAKKLNLTALFSVQWGELSVELNDGNGITFESSTLADPIGVHMGKIIATMNILDHFYKDQYSLEQAYDKLTNVMKQPPAPTWLFTLAAGSGAVALGVIFGLNEWSAAYLIFIGAALGGVTRRYLATITSNLFIQALIAAAIAGIIGAVAVHYQLSSSLRLVALCPCMVLVPGPHILNSSLDFIRGRMQLGMARLALAGLICVSISIGVWVGMKILGVNLPVDPTTSHVVPLWKDTISAGIAIIAYSIFFSTPLRLITWPLMIGILAHMLRWQTLTSIDTSIATSSLLACFLVSVVLTIVAHRQRMPFAALAFAAVVSMIPGVFLFRMTSGIIALTSDQHITFNLLSQTIYDGLNAIVITVAMSIGLLAPKIILDEMISLKLAKKVSL